MKILILFTFLVLVLFFNAIIRKYKTFRNFAKLWFLNLRKKSLSQIFRAAIHAEPLFDLIIKGSKGVTQGIPKCALKHN